MKESRILLGLLTLLLGLACGIVGWSWGGAHQRTLDEAKAFQFARANEIGGVLRRSGSVKPLAQFIELFHPEDAEEMTAPDGHTVSQVVLIGHPNSRYEISVVAPVAVRETGYVLTGEPVFSLTDKAGGKFTGIFPTGTGVGPGLMFHTDLWEKLYQAKGDIESLRVVHRSPSDL